MAGFDGGFGELRKSRVLNCNGYLKESGNHGL